MKFCHQSQAVVEVLPGSSHKNWGTRQGLNSFLGAMGNLELGRGREQRWHPPASVPSKQLLGGLGVRSLTLKPRLLDKRRDPFLRKTGEYFNQLWCNAPGAVAYQNFPSNCSNAMGPESELPRPSEQGQQEVSPRRHLRT